MVAWEDICKLSVNGGIEIRRIRDANKALLAKWLWRYAVDRDSLWRRMIVKKYGETNHWESKRLSCSYGVSCWKGIINQLDDFKKSLGWMLNLNSSLIFGRIDGASKSLYAGNFHKSFL